MGKILDGPDFTTVYDAEGVVLWAHDGLMM